MANYADYNLCISVVAEKAKEFVATGSEIYLGNLPDGRKEHN
jgi:hypothetical protein